MTGYYGEAPVDLGPVDLRGWHEFMHYLYLPVRIPERDNSRVGLGIECDARREPTGPQFAIPERLGFLAPVVHQVMGDARVGRGFAQFQDPYVYITARRGFATPGNPLNRPGWHCDDFGGSDLNYIWSDRFATRFLTSTGPLEMPSDDGVSMEVMAAYATQAIRRDDCSWRVADGPVGHLLGLSSHVIHDTPIIPEPGGMRSFFKISISTHRYNLLGNSHNHLLDYDWPMHDRTTVRNQPGGNGDYVEDPS